LGGTAEPAAASRAVLAHGPGVPRFTGVDAALAVPTAQVRLFGKPKVDGHRRVAVTLARGADVAEARQRARDADGEDYAEGGRQNKLEHGLAGAGSRDENLTPKGGKPDPLSHGLGSAGGAASDA
jgi:hypothetical protein